MSAEHQQMTAPICPRCGKVAIEVKHWGQAGALYVHRHTVEQGIPVQDACRVPARDLQGQAA